MNPLTLSNPAPNNGQLAINTQGLNLDPSASNPNPRPYTSTPSGSSSPWWQRLLPAAGGVAATLLAPETGGASLLADAALFGGGSAAGKLAENLLGHQNATQGVASTGLESAAMGGLAGLPFKGLGILSNMFRGGASAVPEAGAETTGSAVANVANKLGAKMFQGQFDKTLGTSDAQALYNIGVRSDKQLGQVAPLVTGTEGAANKAVLNGLEEAGDNGHVVDLTGLDNVGRQAMADAPLVGLKQTTVDSIGKSVEDTINKALPGDVRYIPASKGVGTFVYEPGALSNAEPTNVFKALKALQNTAEKYNRRDAFGNFTSQANEATYKSLTSVAHDLQDRLFSSSGATMPVSDEVKNKFISDLAPLKQINPAVYSNLTKSIPDNLVGFRSMQAPFVQGSKALRALNTAQEKSGGLKVQDLLKAGTIPSAIGGGVLGGPIGAVVGGVLPALAGSNFGEVLGTKLLGKIGTSGVQGAEEGAANIAKNAPKGILPALQKVSTVLGGIAGTVPNLASNPQSTANINTGTTMNVPQSPIEQIVNELIAQSQTPTGISGNLLTTLSALAPMAQKQELLAPALQNALASYQNAGGAQGMLGGGLSRLSGFIPGTAANTYNRQSAATAELMSQLLGGTPAQAQGLLPGLMQTPGTAAPQIGTLESILGSVGVPAQ